MSLPVVEQISQVIASRLEAVTVAGGYYTDVSEVYRPSRLPDWSPQAGTVVLLAGGAERNEELSPQGNPPGSAWSQDFAILGFVEASDTDTTPIDQLVSVAASDLMKGVCAVPTGHWQTMDGNAINAWWQSQERLGTDGPLEAFRLGLTVVYRTSELDPYTIR